MWKAVLVGTTALAIAGGSLVHAQQSSDEGEQQRSRASVDDRAAYADARIAALKAGLKLTPEQEKLWPAVEKAMRELAKSRDERIRAYRQRRERDEPRSSDPIARLRARADFFSARGAELKQLLDAVEPLYKSLDDAQKRRFRVLARPIRAHPWHSSRWRDDDDDDGNREYRWRGHRHRYDDDMRGPGDMRDRGDRRDLGDTREPGDMRAPGDTPGSDDKPRGTDDTNKPSQL